MTAQVSSADARGAAASAGLGSLAGFGSLFRRELHEWRRARRTWIVPIVTTLFMLGSSVNGWLQANFRPTDGSEGIANPILDPMSNFVGAVGTQIFSLAAIFAVASLLVAERESGTLAWTASKPVSRSAIWLAKFTSSSVVLWVLAGMIPLAITIALLVVLYGPLPLTAVAAAALGIGMSVVLYVAVTLAAATVVTNQAGVAAIGIAVVFLPQLMGLFVPAEFLPGSILQWALMAANGSPPGIVTPLVWGITVAALIAFSIYRMERLEL